MSFDVCPFPLPQTPAGDDPASISVKGPGSADAEFVPSAEEPAGPLPSNASR
jgi:hypothetical protein